MLMNVFSTRPFVLKHGYYEKASTSNNQHNASFGVISIHLEKLWFESWKQP